MLDCWLSMPTATLSQFDSTTPLPTALPMFAGGLGAPWVCLHGAEGYSA